MRTSYRFSVPLLALVSSCLGDAAISPTAPAASTAAHLQVSPSVAILTVGGSLQLTATATTLTDAPISLDSVQYLLSIPIDSLRVRLTPDGMLTALATTVSPVRIDVVGYQGQAAVGEVAFVQITANTVQGATLSIQPVAPDSAKLSAGTTKSIVPVIRNETSGESVPSPVMRYAVRASDASALAVFVPLVRVPGAGNRGPANRPAVFLGANQIRALAGEGSVWVFAEVNAYGSVLRDSVEYTLSYPYTATVATVKHQLALVAPGLANTVVTLAPGATVTFRNGLAANDPLTMTYTFDNSTAAGPVLPASTIGGASGDVTTLTGGQSSRRRFTTPGTYRWTMTASGGLAPWDGQSFSGSIVIK